MELVPILNKENISRPEIEQVEQEKQEYHLIGSFLRTAGHRIFGYNSQKDELFELEVKLGNTINIVVKDDKLVPIDYTAQMCMVDPRFIYFESLNKTNALRRLMRYKSGAIKDLCNLKVPSKEGIKFY